MRRSQSPPFVGVPRPVARAPRPCSASGVVDPTQSVAEAVEFDTARYVALELGPGPLGPSLVLRRTDSVDAAPLGRSAVTALAELQNAVAYLSEGVESVRVRTTEFRADDVATYVETLGDGPLAFGGETFELSVETEAKPEPER